MGHRAGETEGRCGETGVERREGMRGGERRGEREEREG